jgi:hypothetical protein
VDPVEINAGAWYLRALRADDRIDDRPALAEMGEANPDYVEDSQARWAHDSGYTWAVCEPTTGELLAEVSLDPRNAAVSTQARPGHDDAAAVAAEAVHRFAAALGIG